MNLALAILLFFVGGTLVWVASHGTDASTPWEVYRQITDRLRAS